MFSKHFSITNQTMRNAQSVMSNGHSHMNIQSAIRSLVASGRAHILSCYIRQFVYTHTHKTYTFDGQSDVPLIWWVAERGPTAFGKSVCTSNQSLLHNFQKSRLRHTRKLTQIGSLGLRCFQ